MHRKVNMGEQHQKCSWRTSPATPGRFLHTHSKPAPTTYCAIPALSCHARSMPKKALALYPATKFMKRPRGFTLIEVMVVVAIIGIISAIAYPSYTKYIRKARRADGQAALLELAQQMERQYTVANSYSGATLNTGITSRVSAYYTITFSSQQAQSFTIQATPTGDQSSDECGTLSISNTGARTAAANGCWN